MAARRVLAFIVAALVVAGCRPGEAADFDYGKADGQLRLVGTERRSGVDLASIEMPSPIVGIVPLLAVRPLGKRNPPVVVFQHQLGADARQFEAEAIALAGKCGIGGLLVTAPYARPSPWKREFDWRVPNRDAEVQRQAVIELRAVLDRLALLGFDPARVAYVGHSYGANWGGILSGVEPRYRALVLMAGLGSVTATMRPDHPEWSRTAAELGKAGFDRYRSSMRPYDPDQYVRRANRGSLFFQFGKRDKFVASAQAAAFVEAAGPGHQVGWYDTDHEFRDSRSVEDRRHFLSRNLGALCGS